MATGKRIKSTDLAEQTTFYPTLRVLVDKMDGDDLGIPGTPDWLQARNIELSLLGNTYFQGSTNGIDWHDIVTTSDTYTRYSTDGGVTWVELDVLKYQNLNAGYVPYYNGTDLYDSSMYFTSNKVGIGITNPLEALSISSSSTALGIYDPSYHTARIQMYGSGGNGFLSMTGSGSILITSQNNIPSYINAGNFGVGTATPTVELEVDGEGLFSDNVLATTAPTLGDHLTNKTYVDGLVFKIPTVKTADYPVLTTDNIILLDGSSNTVSATLYSAVGTEGYTCTIKCIDDTFACAVIPTGSQEIDGDNSDFVLSLHEVITVVSDGSDWWLI